MMVRERKSITLSLSVDSVEQLMWIGAAFFEEQQQPRVPVVFTHTSATSLARHEDEVISRLRQRLAEKFKLPVDHPFFMDRYLPGEEPRAALLRMFKLLQWSASLTDEQAIESMAKDE